MKRVILCICIILSLCLFVYYREHKLPAQQNIATNSSFDHNTGDFEPQKELSHLYQFIINKLSGSHGVFTNYQDTDQSAEVATGHEVLSESAGLLLRYYVLTNQQDAFEKEWIRTKQTYDRTNGFSYRYSPKLDKKYSVNAAVDDLRIIRALYEAGSVFKNKHYVADADTYAKRFYKHNVKDNHVYDFYDNQYKITNSFITLCYIDLKTLQLISDSTQVGEKTYINMLDIIHNGYISDRFPFYETRYQYDSGSYNSDHINTVESLLTILALSEVKQQNPSSISYLKEQVKQGKLFGQYTVEGVPTNDIQSTAIYAIAAMIGSELDDRELYEDSIQRMIQYQVQDLSSPLYGGFGDVNTLTAYSFDNLMALLAFVY